MKTDPKDTNLPLRVLNERHVVNTSTGIVGIPGALEVVFVPLFSDVICEKTEYKHSVKVNRKIFETHEERSVILEFEVKVFLQLWCPFA